MPDIGPLSPSAVVFLLELFFAFGTLFFFLGVLALAVHLLRWTAS